MSLSMACNFSRNAEAGLHAWLTQLCVTKRAVQTLLLPSLPLCSFLLGGSWNNACACIHDADLHTQTSSFRTAYNERAQQMCLACVARFRAPRAVVRCGRSPTTNFCPSRPCSWYPAHCAKCCSTMDVATVTFRDAVPSPYCGTYTKASHAAICFSLRPWPCRIAAWAVRCWRREYSRATAV